MSTDSYLNEAVLSFLWTADGNWSLGAPPGPGDTVVIYARTLELDGISVVGVTFDNPVSDLVYIYNLVLNNSTLDATSVVDSYGNEPFGLALAFGGVSSSAATMNIGSPGTFSNASFTVNGTFANSGTIYANDGQIGLYGGGEFINSGLISLTFAGIQPATLSAYLTGSDDFDNSGLIEISGGGAAPAINDAVGFFGESTDTVTGNGTIRITDGELLMNAVSSLQTIDFGDAHGVLSLFDITTSGNLSSLSSGAFQGQIEDFRLGDTIEFHTAVTDLDISAPGVFVFTNGVTTVGTLHVDAIVGKAQKFAIGDPGTDNAYMTLVPSCFAAGTAIATAEGAIAVELLRPGDRVRLARGGTAPVRWLGHRRVDCRRHPRPPAVRPVRVAAGAFGSGLPLRDLLLSPDHALYLDGVLIPVRCLIDGAGIRQIALDAVAYWHVELATHDVILAEGLPAESFLDAGNKAAFENGGGAVHLHPDFAQRLWDADACAPLVVAGPQLDRARAKLHRARAHRRAA